MRLIPHKYLLVLIALVLALVVLAEGIGLSRLTRGGGRVAPTPDEVVKPGGDVLPVPPLDIPRGSAPSESPAPPLVAE